MNITNPAGYSEAAAHVFTWLADKALGGTKKAFGWSEARRDYQREHEYE